ncbi:MAG: ABC transporter substrate-binding protein [Leucobacter sp.]
MRQILTSRRSRAIVLTAAAALALPLAACSSAPAEDSTDAVSEPVAAAVAPPAIITEGTLTVCAAILSPPNVYFDEASGEAVGVEVDIARALADELGLDLQLNELGFPGLIPALQAKQCDTIMSSLYIRPEREEIVDFVPYLASGSAIIAPAGNPKDITGLDESLCGLRVAVVTGSTGSASAEELSAECVAGGNDPLAITNVDNPGVALQQLNADQQDAHIGTAEGAGYYSKLGDFSSVGEPFNSVLVGAATLKDNTELHEALQTAFDSIVENGTYAAILEEWGTTGQSING